MNEKDRAEFAEADEELSDLGIDAEIMNRIEDLWLDNQKVLAVKELKVAAGGRLTLADARRLLSRAYGEEPR